MKLLNRMRLDDIIRIGKSQKKWIIYNDDLSRYKLTDNLFCSTNKGYKNYKLREKFIEDEL